jgi:membrane-bound lytic murein transglycosylase D
MRFSLRTILLVLVLACPVLAQSTELPKQGLESRIEFWKKVYTQYGADDIVIHDRTHVNLIYDVAREDDVDLKISVIKSILDEIQSNLTTPENLSEAAKQISDTIVANDLEVSESTLLELRGNIHTQRGIKERFRQGVIRSGRYLDAFQGIFEKQGVPLQIALLPLVESSFENRSLSKAGAAGIWQFTRGTGRLYLTVGRKLDERLDPSKATRAAARLLMDNYNALGSWPLAITAYNHGRGGMQRAQNQIGSDLTSIIEQYDGPLFGYASMNFYSEFMAAVEVYENYQQYFGELVLDSPSTTTPTAAKPPVQLAKSKPSTSGKYKVRSGDSLTAIAQRFRTSIAELMERNNLSNSVIHAGQILLVK